MGAINNAFNQAAGALAGAGIAIKHAKETEESKMNTADSTALVARNQYRAAKAEANEAANEAEQPGGLNFQLAEAETNETAANEAFNKAVNRKNASPTTVLNKMTELRAAQKAADTLREKYKAVEDIQKRAEEQRIYAEKATKMALDAKERFEKHWGGLR